MYRTTGFTWVSHFLGKQKCSWGKFRLCFFLNREIYGLIYSRTLIYIPELIKASKIVYVTVLQIRGRHTSARHLPQKYRSIWRPLDAGHLTSADVPGRQNLLRRLLSVARTSENPARLATAQAVTAGKHMQIWELLKKLKRPNHHFYFKEAARL